MLKLVNLFLKNKKMINLMILDWMKTKFSGDALVSLQINNKTKISGIAMFSEWLKKMESFVDIVKKI